MSEEISFAEVRYQAYLRAVLAAIGIITFYYFIRVKTRKEGEKEQ